MTPIQKRTVLILFGAFVVAAAMNSVLVVLLSSSLSDKHAADVHAIAPMIYLAAGVALAVSIYVAVIKMAGAVGYAGVQTRMILALALAHACTIFGLLLFFLTHRPELFWPFPVLTVVTELTIILPRVLQRVQG